MNVFGNSLRSNLSFKAWRVASLTVLLALASVQVAAQTTVVSNTSQDTEGGKVVTLTNGSACTLSDLFRRDEAGEKVYSLIKSESDELSYYAYASARRDQHKRQLDETLAQQEERIGQMNEALAEMQAAEAAWQESLDPKCTADDLSPKAPARRKEQAAMIERALNNPLVTVGLASGTVATFRDLADRYRKGQSPRRMSPTAYAKFKKTSGWGETKCASDAH